MRRWLVAPAVFLAAVVFLSVHAPSVAAQPPTPKEESFPTADSVQLKGIFHATDKNPNTAPVVVLLYPPGPDRDMTKGDWAGLAKRLTEAGYHVFRFDWRGHGKSTKINDTAKFWENPFLNGNNANYNANITGGPPKKPTKEEISFKDLKQPNRYFPAYLNDLAAVRVHLDSKNDNKSLNSSSIYLIGAGDAATLGMAWLASEWQRPAIFPTGKMGMIGLAPIADYRFVPQQIFGEFPAEGGQDISGAVWLSPNRPASVPEATVKKWVSTQAPKLRGNSQMLFLHADKDDAGKRMSKFFYDDVLVANPRKGSDLKPLKQTFIKEVKGGNTLSGVKLLDNADLKVQDDIVNFLNEVQKVRADLTPKDRLYKTPYYIDTRTYGFFP